MKRALVIGLDNYEKKLTGCVNDAHEIKKLLEFNVDGSHNFDVREITDENKVKRSSRDVMESIKRLFSDDADVALLYFAGHGCEDGAGYLCMSDSIVPNYDISMADILALANKSRCENKVIILDCCFSGKLGEFPLLDNNSLLGEGVTILAACRPEQEAEENIKIEHGIFTNLLIQGLQGKAADSNGNVTPASLYSFVELALGAWNQRPVFKSNVQRFFPLRKTIGRKVMTDVLFSDILGRTEKIKCVDMMFHSGQGWRLDEGKVDIFYQLIEKSEKIRILLNDPNILGFVKKHMGDLRKDYFDLWDVLGKWMKYQEEFPEKVEVRVLDVPILHRYYSVHTEEGKADIVDVKYYTYGNTVPDNNLQSIFYPESEYFKLYRGEFDYLWNHAGKDD